MDGPIAGSRDAGELKNSAAVLENSMTNMFIKDKTYDNFLHFSNKICRVSAHFQKHFATDESRFMGI
jgi:hypothetical protein